MASFRASEFEFRNRLWIFGLVFWGAFALYAVDPVNAAVAASGHDDGRARTLFWLGAGLCGVCALIRTWATAYLKSDVVHDRGLHAESLVADGPYRYVRNPLYLGNILLALGMGWMASRIGFAVMVVGVFLLNYRLILREEAELLASQGESYRQYLQAVPRLFPAFRPRVPAGDGRPNWRDGFTAEIFFWGFAAGMAAFAVTLRLLDFWIVAGVGFALYFGIDGWKRRAR